jgi:hypothetical protein
MSKNAKILILLIFMSFSVIFLLIFSSKPVAVTENVKTKQVNTVNLVKLEASYKNDVKKILIEYEQYFSSSTDSILNSESKTKGQASSTQSNNTEPKEVKSVKVTELKNKLLSLTVPPVSDLMKLHVSLVFAFDKMNSFLTSNNLKAYKESAESIKLAKNNNQWLNQ